jgi:hypothetical protein
MALTGTAGKGTRCVPYYIFQAGLSITKLNFHNSFRFQVTADCYKTTLIHKSRDIDVPASRLDQVTVSIIQKQCEKHINTKACIPTTAISIESCTFFSRSWDAVIN